MVTKKWTVMVVTLVVSLILSLSFVAYASEESEKIKIKYIHEMITYLSTCLRDIHGEIIDSEYLRFEFKRQEPKGNSNKDAWRKKIDDLGKTTKAMSDIFYARLKEFTPEIKRLRENLKGIWTGALQEQKRRYLLRLKEMDADIDFLKESAWKEYLALLDIRKINH